MMKQNIPNLLTVSRIVAAPLLAVAFYLPESAALWTTCALFAYAGLTDFLDGHLARKWQVISVMGKVLDPIADKLLVAAALIPLAAEGRAPMLAVLIILLREIFISGLREHLVTKGVALPVTTAAKYKTAVQMLAIALLLLGPASNPLQSAGVWLLWVATLLTLYSGVDYFRRGWRALCE